MVQPNPHVYDSRDGRAGVPWLSLGAALAFLALCPVPGPAQTGDANAPKPAPAKGSATRPRTEQPAPPAAAPILIAPDPETKTKAPVSRIAGVYSVEGSAAEIVVKGVSGDVFYIASSDGWDAVGFLDDTVYHGVFRHLEAAEAPGGAIGELTVDWNDPERPSIRAKYTVRRAGEFSQRWRRVTDSRREPVAKPPPPPGDGSKPPGYRPGLGEYVPVDELPEAITKPDPIYPDDARRAGTEGTVVVHVLVLEDGTVGDTRIAKSSPPFDDAAVACVRRWRFKPALSHGVPVAVWVAVPIRFTNQYRD